MSLENISIFVTIALVITIVVFLSKKMIALALAIGAILILFNVGFVMNGAEIRNFFNLDDYLDQEQADAVENAFNDFDDKREEYGVIDPEQVLDGMENAIANGTAIIIDGIGHIDIVKFSQAVTDKLLAAGAKDVDKDALRESIKKQLSGIKDSDLDKIMDMIEENLNSETQSPENKTSDTTETE
jgi:spermidine/putrescine-binding protein